VSEPFAGELLTKSMQELSINVRVDCTCVRVTVSAMTRDSAIAPVVMSADREGDFPPTQIASNT